MGLALCILSAVLIGVLAWVARLDHLLSRLLERERKRDEDEAERLRRRGL